MDLNEDLPLGAGTADLTAWTACPYCGEQIELLVDPGGGAVQRYVEDCEVCCRPMKLAVSWDAEGAARVAALTDEDT